MLLPKIMGVAHSMLVFTSPLNKGVPEGML